ncbi:phage integrase N-terminal domain-containing protein [Lentisalinibacter orientalis]|uniref:phage integrase N-terminal domain-containing protein n=1 Tax=Lentisalinibacter orientalis TaxID=2992241 RepID=UPI00386CFB92
MKDLNYQLKEMCRNNRDGSYRTQAARERILTLIADQLQELGFRRMGARTLRPKHVRALVERWQEEGLAPATLKNRMCALRWWAAKVDRRHVVHRSNEDYGIPARRFITNESKARSVTTGDLEQIPDTHVRWSLELQQAFGLRREEAIKFRPSYADQCDHLLLKASWTKGGKAREVPIRTQEQRALLNRLHQSVGTGSLIPDHLSYRQQVRRYERYTADAGLSRMHGLRHAYAQRRYRELTGWDAPAAGGPRSQALSREERRIDREARAIISRELGHEREQIVGIYCGA